MAEIMKKAGGAPKGGPPIMIDLKQQPGWPGEAPVIEDDKIVESYEAEVVVVGAGHAGTQCALAAAEGGASVIVIEKQPSFENIRYTGEQIGTFNSEYFINKGFGPYDLIEVIQEFCRSGCYRINQRLISMYVRNSGEMLDHMISLVPEDSDILDDDQCNIHEAYGKPEYPVITGGQKTWAGTLQFRGKLVTDRNEKVGMGQNSRLSEFERFAVKHSAELGAKWLNGYEAVLLIKDGERVTGVIAKDIKTGKYIKVLAKKGVGVTTGNASDSGHKLCVWAGGKMEKVVRDTTMPYDASPMFGMTCFLTINADGERFCDESNPYNIGPQLYFQPKGLTSTVFDSNWLENLKANGIHHSMPDMGIPGFLEQLTEDISHVVEHGAEGYGVRSMSASERMQSTMWGANTLDELADYIGYTGQAKENYLKSIKRYNEICKTGKDDDFGRDPKTLIPIEKPPFYGAKINNMRSRSSSDSMCPSGIETDNDMNVTDADFKPIPGLYVAGNTLGGRYYLYYPTPCGGNMIGMAMTHGRMRGKMLSSGNFES